MFPLRPEMASLTRHLGVEEEEKHVGAVLDLEWHPDKPHLLIALHHPSSLVLWNSETGAMMWKCDFSEPLQSISLNPFDRTHLCVASTLGWIYFVRGTSSQHDIENIF